MAEGFVPGGVCLLMCMLPLGPGAASWTAAQSRRNFEVVGRLVTPGDPLKSRLLLQPLSANAGGTPAHPGGKAWQSQTDPGGAPRSLAAAVAMEPRSARRV